MATSTKTPAAETVATKKAPAVAKKPAAKKAPAPQAASALTAPATAPAKPAVKKAAAKKPAAKTSAVKKAATPQHPPAEQTMLKPSTAPKPVISAEQRNHYVSVAAFYIAERRGFTLGNPAEDWLAAEAEIDRLIASGHFIP